MREEGRWRRVRFSGWAMLALTLWLATTGLTSSNDGSHLALARALVLRGSTTIDAEVALTLWVDRAKRDGHQYSDRPPGTAFASLPAVAIGDWLDPGMLRAAMDHRDVVFTPASPAYLKVYSTRPARLKVAATPILAYQGTAAALSIYTVGVGLLGLWAVARVLVRRGVGPAGRAFAVAGLALGTLWGPYSTTLFSHVTTGTMLGLMLVSLDALRDAASPRRRAGLAVAAGFAASWAVSADYLACLLVLGVAGASLDWRQHAKLLPWLLLGAVPLAVATAAYHDAAFGSPFSLGYDYQANFKFARDRVATFSGDPRTGLWTLWGMGQGAGVFALAPLAAFGVVGLVRSPWRWAALGAAPWALVLALHKTPAGGGSVDHRYLVPMLPLVGLGLGALWQRLVTEGGPGRRWLGAALVAVAAASSFLVWTHFLALRS